MKQPGLQTQNQRNKRKDGEADRWPDASFFPLKNEKGNNPFPPYIKWRRKQSLPAIYQMAKETIPSRHISNGEGNNPFPHRNKKALNAMR